MAREQQGRNSGTELGRFLRARRTEVSPEEAGITVGPGLRRTPGLRREELATLAGVSIDYYARLERGREVHPSPAVLDALARALQLGEIEHKHLHDLCLRAARRQSPDRSMPSRSVDPGTELLLERLRPFPARVLSRTMDLLASNPGGLRTLPGIERWPVEQRNVARYVFLHPMARELFPDWEVMTRGCVARLRALAGTDPDAPDLAGLVEELRLKSPDFTRLWESYDVRGFAQGDKAMDHPEVGALTLRYQSLLIEGTPGHRLVTYYALPDTPDHDALVLLDQADQDRGASPAEEYQG
ncbi:helix-turn-helix transcriptional regulator [Streptomyces phaeochromogenes]|uniref:Helix-turn-helix transcriptional regulator n=1 Tax=Streptomyces phaeochromogenes TaxID=1923 RepID=A0ABZ1HRH3_STRPH|nr:helix-turn-helix transcriptional regulator [Streptomyces phaeochromogenes]WSD19714.1 helix-turn-helix transcriptional regulator [Streptomyces phaeochromogenes]